MALSHFKWVNSPILTDCLFFPLFRGEFLTRPSSFKKTSLYLPTHDEKEPDKITHNQYSKNIL
jgi:hypothetical protein